jgi:hypothetical protein
VVELLVGSMLSLALLTALTGAIGTGGRVLTALGRRGEIEDTAHVALEALAFDVRRAGWDPAAAGVEALSDARPARLTVQADLDGDGIVDASSEETVTYVCNLAGQKLSRVVGRQSLPLADTVTACAFRYLDATGAVLPAPAAGLPAADRRRVRAVLLDFGLAPNGPGAPTARTAMVTLRTAP